MQVISKENPIKVPGAYRFGEFELFPLERQLLHHKKVASLPPKAFDALVLLVQNAERLVRKEELVRTLWPDTYVAEANLTNTIVALRKLLGRDAIETVSKYGYRFTLQVLGEPGVDEAAYSNFARAKELIIERSLDSLLAGRDLCLLCIARDPGFAAAWAWLGRCCRMIEKVSGPSSVNMELAGAALRRALELDPNLACAHQFYTQLQADLGHARDAVERLTRRLGRHPQEAESFAGLVHVLRFCGLVDESVEAHRRASALDPTVLTSVANTHFLRGQYEATIESYSGRKGYYLDAASWMALGDAQRAKSLLPERLRDPQLSALMVGLMSSLLALAENRDEDAVAIVERTQVAHEPEVVFYLARHLSRAGEGDAAIGMLRRARVEGFTASRTMAEDPWFAPVGALPEFASVLKEAKAAEAEAKQALADAGGAKVMSA